MGFHQQNVHQKQVKTLLTMEGRLEHDPSMSQKRILYETSFQNACEDLQNEAILRDLLKKGNWKT